MSKNFIEAYTSALTDQFCDQCIGKFESSLNTHSGKTGFGFDPDRKNSTDITLNNFPDEWQNEIVQLQHTVLTGLCSYIRTYPFLLAGAIALQHQDKSGVVRNIEYTDVEQMDDATLRQIIMKVYRLGNINIQKYQQNQGGYFHWHSEHFPHPQDPANLSLHRTLLWMFYLNDVEEGGETDFYYQDVRVKPAKGTLVIAPAGFTHTHRGAMPVSSDKYIFTSWVLFQDAKEIYGKV
ncbi:MAG: 2OG-Fe(II) oxygenase [Proteobacteria bacterium]|nr:2OG-Fe(II) oxygenase [Pseudomonadota bacterium]